MYRRFIVVAFLLLSFMFLSVNGLAIGTLSGDFDGYNEAQMRHEDPWTGKSKLKDNMSGQMV